MELQKLMLADTLGGRVEPQGSGKQGIMQCSWCDDSAPVYIVITHDRVVLESDGCRRE